MKKHKKHQQAPRLALRREELVAILEKAKTSPLGQGDFETLLGAVDTLAFVMQELEAKGASLQRLRNMLFGSSTEKTDIIFKDEKPANTSSNSIKIERQSGSKEKAPGHGRNGAASYTGAKKNRVQVLHNDDTTARILKWMTPDDQEANDEAAALGAPRDGLKDDAEKRERSGIYTSDIVSIDDEHRMALFFTGRQHAGENLADVLARRSKALSDPIPMGDALSVNTSPAMATILANCLSHGRRQCVDIANNFPEACRHVLESLREVYKNDEIARERMMTDEERLAFHQAESGPWMQDLETWMKEQLDDRLVKPHSGLGEAIANAMN